MRLEHRRPHGAREGFSATDRVDLMNQATSWDSKLVSLSADTTDPEAQSSALLLGKSQYFIKAKEILNTPSMMEPIARRVSDLQRRLAELRTQRKEKQSSAQRKELQAQVRATLAECRKGRKQIWVHDFAADFRKRDLLSNSDFYNKHLGRMGLPQNSLLRPEALVGISNTETTSDEKDLHLEPLFGDSKPSKPKSGKKSGTNGIDPVKDPELWLAHLPKRIRFEGETYDKRPAAEDVAKISTATAHQRVAATLFWGYEFMLTAPIARFLGIDRRAVQKRKEGFFKHAKKQNPNWASHLSGEQDIIRGRMATPRLK